jgi:hypothetical protein
MITRILKEEKLKYIIVYENLMIKFGKCFKIVKIG